jgi:hypothetical protein
MKKWDNFQRPHFQASSKKHLHFAISFIIQIQRVGVRERGRKKFLISNKNKLELSPSSHNKKMIIE